LLSFPSSHGVLAVRVCAADSSLLNLDAHQRVLAHVELFRGSLTQTSVYPREVVKDALRPNCAGFSWSTTIPADCVLTHTPSTLRRHRCAREFLHWEE